MTNQPKNLIETPLQRRSILALCMSSVALAALPGTARAQEENDLRTLKRDLFGDRKINTGRVTVTIPPISENGNSVPFSVDVDSPMLEQDYVKQIVILSPLNPEPIISRYEFNPAAGRAAIATRIRLAGSQNVEAIAEMSDGTLWQGSATTLVTLAACVIG